MTNFLQLQLDLLGVLQNSEALASNNCMLYRKFRQDSEIEFSALYQTVRNGRAGCGLMVEMPRYEVVNPNAPGPERKLLIDLLVVEEPNLNMEPATGTLVSAEEAADFALEECGDLGIDGIGELYPDRRTINPASDMPDGLIAYRVTLVVYDDRQKKTRVPQPTIAEAEGVITFTNAAGFEDATIYYTVDGSFPGEANDGALTYTVPFDASAIETVRWRAYRAGNTGSFVGQVVNPDA